MRLVAAPLVLWAVGVWSVGAVGTAQRPSVTLTTITGDVLRAAVVGVEDGRLRLVAADGAAAALPLDELESIDCGGAAPLPQAGPGRVWLRTGSDLGARLAGGTAGGVRLDVGLGEPATFQLVHLRALRLEAADAAGDYDGFVRALGDPHPTDDLLFAWNRQTGKLSRLSVRVLGLDGDSLRVDYRGERTVPLAQVHGIVFGRDNGVRPPSPRGVGVAVRLAADGPRLEGALTGWGEDALQLRLAEGPEVALPLRSVHRIDVRSSRVLRLSSVAPVEVVQVPAFESPRPWLVDRAPGGPGLDVGGRHFARGLCLIPRTRLGWSLDAGAFDVFEATIGIDARSTGPADAVFRVLLDGEVVFERTHVVPGAGETVRVPLGDATRLALEVDFGERLDLGDHCVFADARLLEL